MTHQEFDKRLDEILARYATGDVEDLLPAGISAEMIEEAKKQSLYEDKYFVEAKQAIRELFEEYRTTITGKEGGDESLLSINKG